QGGATLTTRLLITAPGLQAQAVAGLIDGYPAERIPAGHFGKGVYFRLSGKAPFERLIYPPPIPGALGTHYRRDLGGQAVFGPDLAYVADEDYSVDPTRRDGFVSYIRRFWPGVEAERLAPDYAGIRPKLHGPDEAQPDFQLHGAEVHGIDGLMALFGIESPGLTSSLAIGEAVARRIGHG
ncbi:FAD-dependent oxidoreductase, partial [Rhizobium sp. CRIBSB]|nr:FAD-dependent oxidoreductase [Rhizobium sp. CRIBSB]